MTATDEEAKALLSRVDPQLAPALDLLPNFATLCDATLADFRAALQRELPVLKDQSGLSIEEIRILSADGSSVRGLLYSRPGEVRPALLNLHGGGYVTGSIEREHDAARLLALECEIDVLSVAYRLAPETPYPGGLEDCYAGLCWLHTRALARGADAPPVGIRGNSAGGGLAAALALLARERGGPTIAWLGLIYPMLDDRTARRATRASPVWSQPANLYGWRAYLGALFDQAHIPATAVPARAHDLADLPATFLAVGALDLFLAENLEFARRLVEGGVPTELHVYPGAYHGFPLVKTAAVSQRYERDFADALQRGLRRSASSWRVLQPC
jgi:acetyl esterase/lipase